MCGRKERIGVAAALSIASVPVLNSYLVRIAMNMPA